MENRCEYLPTSARDWAPNSPTRLCGPSRRAPVELDRSLHPRPATPIPGHRRHRHPGSTATGANVHLQLTAAQDKQDGLKTEDGRGEKCDSPAGSMVEF